jgi:hypothetical protein
MSLETKIITDYWHKYYCDKVCTLCGNSGFIDTHGVKSNVGIKVGRLNYCICPNGQQYRRRKIMETIRYKTIQQKEIVLLDNKIVGAIKQVKGGWQYFPKGSKTGGVIYCELSHCKYTLLPEK